MWRRRNVREGSFFGTPPFAFYKSSKVYGTFPSRWKWLFVDKMKMIIRIIDNYEKRGYNRSGKGSKGGREMVGRGLGKRRFAYGWLDYRHRDFYSVCCRCRKEGPGYSGRKARMWLRMPWMLQEGQVPLSRGHKEGRHVFNAGTLSFQGFCFYYIKLHRKEGHSCNFYKASLLLGGFLRIMECG